MKQDYHLIGNSEVVRGPKKFKRRFTRQKRRLLFYSIILIIFFSLLYLFFINAPNYDLILIKGQSRKDKYGVELNKYVLDGVYSIGYEGNINKKIDEWNLYAPPCPNLHPVHYPESISNPVCEESSLQFVNYNNNGGRGLPYSIKLDSISNQLKNWKSWEKKNKDSEGPLYKEQKFENLFNGEYHPYDYGYDDSDTSKIDDEEYYKSVVNSRMDKVPDPRRRRLFSFILFNTEFNILDAYLSEYYEIFDYFVIYECNTTFSGIPKPYYFTRALLETNRYDRFKDKLIPLPLENIIDEDNGRGKAFPKEHIARRLLIEKGLRAVHARHGDIYIHGDLDEFPKAHVLYRMKKCGGWEYLQMGIGGGPKSFKDTNVKSYLVDKTMDVKVDELGNYLVDYDREVSLGFLSWFHEYSFEVVRDHTIGTFAHPDVAIFDARRSLGQLNERYNKRPENEDKTKRENYDMLLDPDFDPYQGYTYTDNTNDRRTGKGYLGEEMRNNTLLSVEDLNLKQKTLFWSSGWHLSTFLPTLDLIYNKISSYSHFDCYVYFPKFLSKMLLKYRINRHAYIFGSFKPLDDNYIILPKSYKKGYDYNFSYLHWKELIQNNATDTEFKNEIDMLIHEIPSHIWQNPICYSYMIDRNFGFDKKVWWEVVQKDKWSSIQFKDLDSSIIDSLLPQSINGTFKKEFIETLKSDENI
ncbi:hypothetical protein LY90DRAFT_699978 [Neocallimastix californiae]|jgi:hypothetical protein|uniref:Glycosyltransferase family 17 protein n=1 Tax=Neocallimastix californiae TaxID=1754190 RepID=A0A1Y2EMP9_9FUNG|nr:hypothetical protein LY90DRAFT_699978 [Neocallimastix californiae]|eukprot:ORY72516.1 hypothetical protein LY90DRAFT_699978 [Neocallimastix californiae]